MAADISYVLNRHIFLNGVVGTAGGPRYSTPFPCDYRFSGNQERTFYVSAAAADTVKIETCFDREVSAANIWFLVTAFSGANAYTAHRVQPFTLLRASVQGASGVSANVLGIV